MKLGPGKHIINQINLLKASTCTSDHIATTFGLNTSEFFHVTTALAPDVFHDLLEGCLQYKLKELLRHLISEKTISLIKLNDVNDVIQSFPIGYADIKNKPSILSPAVMSLADHTLKQNGKHHPLCEN